MAETIRSAMVCDPSMENCYGEFPGISEIAHWEDDNSRFVCQWGGWLSGSAPKDSVSLFYTISCTAFALVMLIILIAYSPYKYRLKNYTRKFISYLDLYPDDFGVTKFEDDDDLHGTLLKHDGIGLKEGLLQENANANELSYSVDVSARGDPRNGIRVKTVVGGFATLVGLSFALFAIIYVISENLDPRGTQIRPFLQPGIAHESYHGVSIAVKLHVSMFIKKCPELPLNCTKVFNVTGDMAENLKCTRNSTDPKNNICHLEWDTCTAFVKKSYNRLSATWPSFHYKISPRVGTVMIYSVSSYMSKYDYNEEGDLPSMELSKKGHDLLTSAFGSFLFSGSHQCFDMTNPIFGLKARYRRVHLIETTSMSSASQWNDPWIQGLVFSETDYPYYPSAGSPDPEIHILTDPEPLTWIVQVPSPLSLVITALTILGSAGALPKLFKITLNAIMSRIGASSSLRMILYGIPFVFLVVGILLNTGVFRSFLNSHSEVGFAFVLFLIGAFTASLLSGMYIVEAVRSRK